MWNKCYIQKFKIELVALMKKTHVTFEITDLSAWKFVSKCLSPAPMKKYGQSKMVTAAILDQELLFRESKIAEPPAWECKILCHFQNDWSIFMKFVKYLCISSLMHAEMPGVLATNGGVRAIEPTSVLAGHWWYYGTVPSCCWFAHWRWIVRYALHRQSHEDTHIYHEYVTNGACRATRRGSTHDVYRCHFCHWPTARLGFSADPVPTSLYTIGDRYCSAVCYRAVQPFLLASGQVPAEFKRVFIRPIKKAGLDGDEVGSYNHTDRSQTCRPWRSCWNAWLLDSMWLIHTVINYLRRFNDCGYATETAVQHVLLDNRALTEFSSNFVSHSLQVTELHVFFSSRAGRNLVKATPHLCRKWISLTWKQWPATVFTT
jgi:hypothetical protein